MSLLQQNANSTSDAAPGEELTRGSSNKLLAAIIAALLVSLALILYVRLGEKPPVATAEVTSVVSHRMHRETSGMDANGAPMPKDVFDQVLVFAHVRLQNQSKGPIFLHQVMANATLPDGIHTSYAASPVDYERIFQGYPELASLHGHPIPIETTIEAGQTLEGDFVSALRLNNSEWDSRKDLNFTFAFRYQPVVTAKPSAPVIDR
jgi:hypothetical protein